MGRTHLVLLCEGYLRVCVDGDEVERQSAPRLDGLVRGDALEDGRERLTRPAPAELRAREQGTRQGEMSPASKGLM